MFEPSLSGLFWVIGIGLVIILADVFLETEVLSVGALLGISVYASWLVELDLKWRVLTVLLGWIGLVTVFYLFWRRLCVPFIRRGFMTGMEESVNTAVGASAEYRLIDGKAFVYWNGDLWPLEEASPGADGSGFADHDRVTITANDNGVFRIQAVD